MKKKAVEKKSEIYHLLMYVQDSSPKIKKFKTMQQMGKFVEKFQKQNPDHMAGHSGYWIDYVVSGVTGDVHFFTDGISVE